jgi:hypothetical protein
MGHIGSGLFSAPVCASFGSDAYGDGILFVACSSGIKALGINTAAPSFSTLWTGPGDANGPPIIAGGLVWVAATGSSKLYGLDRATGAVKVNVTTPAMEHFTTPSASDGKLFLATDQTLTAYTIATAASTTTTTPQPTTTPTASTCPTPVKIALPRPIRGHATSIAVYEGRRRIALLHGSHLTGITLRRIGTGSVRLRVVARPPRGKAVTSTVKLNACRQVR